MNKLSCPIVILSSIEWDFTWQRHQALATELAKVSPGVIFVESLPKRFPKVREINRVFRRLFKFRGKSQNLSTKNEASYGVMIISPFTLPATTYSLNWINRYFFIPKLVSRIQKLVNNSPPIIINYLPTQTVLDITQSLNPKLLIYDYVDRWYADTRTPKSVITAHETILEKANLVITPSQFLAEEVKRLTAKLPMVVSHGVDYSLFNQIDTGKLVEKINLVGYFGGIGPYIDYPFLQKIAEVFHLVMVGPLRDKLPPMRKVTWKPLVPHHQLISEIEQCDAFVIPYKNDEYGKGINPIKLLEYFATGKPVIGIPIPALEKYKEVMIFAENGFQAVEKLSNIHLWENSGKRLARLQIARENSWKSKSEIFINEINKKLSA